MGWLWGSTQKISDYFSLDEQNDALAAENARLTLLLAHRRDSLVRDSLSRLVPQDGIAGDFIYTPACISKISNNSQHNDLILDKGSADGIEVGYGVITAKGVIGIIDAVRTAREKGLGIPIVWNTGGYERVETLKSLEGLIDIYLPDLKYLSSELSARLSGAKDYPDFATAAILEMARQTGSPILDENGMMKRGTMVRHLVLPGYTNQSIEVLKWLAQHKDKLWVSIMFQYTPMTEVPGAPSLSRTLTKRECEKIWDVVDALGLTDGYVQERESSGTGMIPLFDLTGI